MAKQPSKIALVSSVSFGAAVAAFVGAVAAVAVSPYTPVAHSTQEALDKAALDLVAASEGLSGGAPADPADLQAAIQKSVIEVLAAQRADLVTEITEKLQAEIQTGLDALKASMADAVKAEVLAQKSDVDGQLAEVDGQLAELKAALPDLVKAEVTAQIPPPAADAV
jgi:hypothetical protein